MDYGACVSPRVSGVWAEARSGCRGGSVARRSVGGNGETQALPAIGGCGGNGERVPFLSSIVTVSFAHFMRNLVLWRRQSGSRAEGLGVDSNSASATVRVER